MKFYVTCTTVHNSGRISCNLVDVVEADKKPESTSNSNSRCDVYIDYFDSKEEALAFVEESRLA